MKPKDIFNVAVRLVGLLFLYQSLSAVPNAFLSVWPLFPRFSHFVFGNILPNLWIIGWPLVIAVWLIRGAPWLMKLAYGKDETRTPASLGSSQAELSSLR